MDARPDVARVTQETKRLGSQDGLHFPRRFYQEARLALHKTEMTMKIVIPGGTGQVGTLLARAFHRDGHEVTIWGRQPPMPAPWRVEQWNPAEISLWAQTLEESTFSSTWRVDRSIADTQPKIAGRSWTRGSGRFALWERRLRN